MTESLRKAAQAVLDRWDSPQWEWTKQGPTADLMNELRKELANNGWQPIETAQDGEMLLFADMKAQEARYWAFCGWIHAGLIKDWVQMPNNTVRTATHWMPLPPIPKVEP